MNDNDSLHNCLLSSFIQTPLEKWIAPPSSSCGIVGVASSVRCGSLQTALGPPWSPVSSPQCLTFPVGGSWFQVNFSNKSEWVVYTMSPWVQEIAFLLPLFIQPSGIKPLHSCLFPYRPFNLPAFLAEEETCDVSWVFVIFTDNLWLSFSVWVLIFSSHLCSLKMVSMFWDVVHFSLISTGCCKPFGLWSLFLLIVIIAICWL